MKNTKKKIKITLFIIFIVYAFVVLIKHNKYSFSPATVHTLNVEVVKVYSQNQDMHYILTEEQKDQILEEMQKLKETHEIGRREAWQDYYTIDLIADSQTLYRIQLATRHSIKGNIIASFHRVVNDHIYYYGHYNANELFRLVENMVKVRNGQ
jgi:hypothetical protein